MSVEKDPSLYGSDYERNENERYFTHPWVTNALVRHLPDYLGERKVWEPAAGRGDMTGVLMDQGYDVFSSDIDLTEFQYETGPGKAEVIDFLETENKFEWCEEYSAIITNPPYGGGNVLYEGRKIPPSEAFVRKALSTGIDYVAMVLRSEFNSAATRTDLFLPGSNFVYEIVLTKRPRWDWWYKEKSDANARHNFSIFVWDSRFDGSSTQFWEGINAR